MNILPSTGPDPVGAVTLLTHADPVELERFQVLEDAIWGGTSLSPAVIESVRLRCAHVRGCIFCSAVRIQAAIEDGLSEEQIGRLDTAEARAALSEPQRAALALTDRFLLNPSAPLTEESAWIAETLGSRGVLEVLLACAVFATAELRIALGENREPNGSGVFNRARGQQAPRSADTQWPSLSAAILSPDAAIPQVDPALSGAVRGLLHALWAGTDIATEVLAACSMRSAQLHGVAESDPLYAWLAPPFSADSVDADRVRSWPSWSAEEGRDVLALAEQLWLDPAGVDERIVAPLLPVLGSAGVIRIAWDFIWIGQLHRLALVLHRSSG